MKIPEKLQNILNQDQKIFGNIVNIVNPFSAILTNNDLYFFEDYTDHGIKHVEDTLQYVENLIAEDTFGVLTPNEIGVMIIAVVLHDIGMHTNTNMFKNMLEGKYDHVPGLFSKEKTWKTLWEEYLYDSKYWDAEKKVNIFGDGESNHRIDVPNLENTQLLNGYDRKFIGEFIRIHHCRIAYEVAQAGYIGREIVPFNNNGMISEEMMKIAGIVARSHGMNVRDTFNYMEEQFGDFNSPLGYHAVYLMVLLRLADILQIDNSRTNNTVLSIGIINSPYSRQEHKTHLAIKNIQFKNIDKEKIIIQGTPKDAKTYTKIEWSAEVIQKEFDLSWAILGEVYPDNDYKLRYRRITTNIKNEKYKERLTFIPKHFKYRFNNEIAKLLIAPLYGDSPSYGVRELVQNAVDACRECMNDVRNSGEEPHVTVEVDTQNKLFTITDTGKGMTLHEIEHYFLTIGSSYNGNVNWQKKRDAEHIYRTGRFGIGVLAAYLLGPEIIVETRSRSSETGYRFKASLEDKFIQIDKVANAAFGTKIEIKCDETSIVSLSTEVMLFNNASRHFKDDDYLTLKINIWFGWYIDEKPKVEYYCDGERIQIRYRPLKYLPLEHKCEKYGKISWKPQLFLAHKNQNCSLFCNGFFITNESNKKKFSLIGLNNYFPFEIPSLQIADIHNTLPLNLQRSNIEEGIKYEFEEELAKDMFTELIFQLMAINPIEGKVSIHIRDYYFSASGFALKNQYTHDKLRGKQIIKIGVLDEHRFDYSEWENIFRMFPDTLFHFSIESFGYHVGLSNYTSEDNFRNDLSTYLSKHPHFVLKIRNKNYRGVDPIMIKVASFLVGKADYDNGIHYYSYNLENKSLLKQLTEMIKDETSLSDSDFYIFLEDIEKGENNSMIHAVFDKYLDGDPIIPYDITQRKKKYPLIYKEYESEIKEREIMYKK